MRAQFAIALVVAILVPPAAACLWDYDTLKMERSRFPDALELITGKFLRHSDDYYRWRVEDRLAKIEGDPENAALYDDLAVAYDKLGEHAKAIETIREVESFAPGRYETEANLGTFLVHSGKFEEGLEHLRKAVEINPDAHFGREVYQILLVEYVLEKRNADGTLPQPLDESKTRSDDDSPFYEPHGFGAFVLEQQGIPAEKHEERNAEIKRALKGVLGMMRFGHHDSPVLLEAVGDLLSSHVNEDAKRLATRAYLKVAQEADSDEARSAFRRTAKSALYMQIVSQREPDQISLEAVEATFDEELAEAEAWHADLVANERKWIEEGKDVDAEFTSVYYDEPVLGEEGALPVNPILNLPLAGRIAIAGALVLLVAGVVVMRARQGSLLRQDTSDGAPH